MNTFFSTTNEFRKLLASKEFTDYRMAVAFVTKNMAIKILGHFFINVNKPATPTKMFTNEADAFKWLQAFTEKVE